MINLIFLMTILCNNKSTNCKELLTSNFRESIIEVVGKKKYQLLLENNENKLTYKIELDSIGNVIEISTMRNNCLTDSLAIEVCNHLKKKKYCLYNTDPHLTFEEFIKFGNNKFQYIIPIGSLKK